MSEETIEGVRAERDSLKKALAERSAQLDAVNKEFEQFSHSLSHDLRAPLRALEGFAQILIDDYSASLDAEGKRCVEILGASARKASLLIEDLLVLSRLCRRPFNPGTVKTQDLIAHAVTELKGEGVKAEFEVEDLPDCWGDAELLTKTWDQLLRNAVKFSHKKDKPHIVISGRVEDGRVVYAVKDNGIGFEAKYAGRLFGIFQRLQNDPQYDGRGIGLAIVQRLVHRHGGEVKADGVLNEGATFSFSLPRPHNQETAKN